MAERKRENRRRQKTFLGQVKMQGKTASLVLYILLYVFCVVAGVLSAQTEKYTYTVGGICEETITANKDLVDEYSTEILREEAKQKVLPVYQLDDTILNQNEENIYNAFSQIEQIRQKVRQIYLAQPPEQIKSVAETDWEALLGPSMEEIRAERPDYLTDQNIYTIASMEPKQLETLRDAMVEKVRIKMKDGVTADDLVDMIESVRSELISGGAFTSEQALLAHAVATANINSNLTYNIEATESARLAAAEAVKPVQYQKGQNIVQKGEIISEAQLRLIKQMGLMTDERSGTSRWIFSALLMAAVFGIALLYCIYQRHSVVRDAKSALCMILLSALGIVVALICKRIDLRIAPVFLPVIIGAVILRRKTALLYGVWMSIIISFIMAPQKAFFFDDQVLRSMLAGLLGSFAVVLIFRGKQSRAEYIYSGMAAGVMAAVVYLCYGILEGYTWQQYLAAALFSLGSGVLCGFLAIGILPIWEACFSLATPSRLLELSNPSNPLLRRLMIEASGTYHHSVMVANLAEAGAEVVDADALLTRVSAYYHDIGKLSNPLMFKENQMNVANPHDSMTPEDSAKAIRSHITDGVALARKNRLPQQMVDIISQHHGDGTVTYFYRMARMHGEIEDESIFHYPSIKPQTKEAGVLMLADVVEAAIRANNAMRLDLSAIHDQIQTLVIDRYNSGQLDECPLTRRDMTNIIDAFVRILQGANHERIAYPEDPEK